MLAGAFANGYVASIPAAAGLLGCHQPDDPFLTARQLKEQLHEYGLAIRPPIESGEFEQPRVIFAPSKIVDCRGEIDCGESSNCEFKATLLFHIAQARANPELAPKDLDHEICVNAVLKSIAGFLNRRGGIVYIGVGDDGRIFGLESDLLCLRRARTFDEWEQHLQSVIASRLTYGKRVLSQLGIGMHMVDEKVICRMTVPACDDEVFVRDKSGKFHFYVRTGNRTDELQIEDMPGFVRERLRQR